MARRLRTVTGMRPSEQGRHEGLAYTMWLPADPAWGGVVILHGAGSSKESHHDFARAASAAGLAALAFDARGHGESDGPMDGRAVEDVAAVASLLRARVGAELPLALRGSSMGGYLALLAADRVAARAVVAICPAPAEGLLRGLRAGSLRFDADVEAVSAFLERHPLDTAVAALDLPVLLLHAGGDEQVPVQHSRELAQRLAHEASRLIEVPGGHHRSIQHDEELQAVSLRWLRRALSD